MNIKNIDDLIELGIYSSRILTEEDYNILSRNNLDDNLFYITGCYENVDDECNKFYKEINNNGLTEQDLKLQLEIYKIKNIKSIKTMITFFVIITIINIIITLFSVMNFG